MPDTTTPPARHAGSTDADAAAIRAAYEERCREADQFVLPRPALPADVVASVAAAEARIAPAKEAIARLMALLPGLAEDHRHRCSVARAARAAAIADLNKRHARVETASGQFSSASLFGGWFEAWYRGDLQQLNRLHDIDIEGLRARAGRERRRVEDAIAEEEAEIRFSRWWIEYWTTRPAPPHPMATSLRREARDIRDLALSALADQEAAARPPVRADEWDGVSFDPARGEVDDAIDAAAESGALYATTRDACALPGDVADATYADIASAFGRMEDDEYWSDRWTPALGAWCRAVADAARAVRDTWPRRRAHGLA